MGVPVIPILKKVAIALVSDEKGRKWIGGVICGITFLMLMPVITLMAIFSGGIEIDMNGLLGQVNDQQAQMEIIAQEIEDEMLLAGYSERQIEYAQTFYMIALHDEGDDNGFIEQLMGCFVLEEEAEQTEEELVEEVNEVFGKDINLDEFLSAVEELHGTHVLDE